MKDMKLIHVWYQKMQMIYSKLGRNGWEQMKRPSSAFLVNAAGHNWQLLLLAMIIPMGTSWRRLSFFFLWLWTCFSLLMFFVLGYLENFSKYRLWRVKHLDFLNLHFWQFWGVQRILPSILPRYAFAQSSLVKHDICKLPTLIVCELCNSCVTCLDWLNMNLVNHLGVFFLR